MKRGLSGWERAFVVVPVLGVLLAWQWNAVRHAWYREFPLTLLPDAGNIYEARFSGDGRLVLTTEISLSHLDYGGPSDVHYSISTREADTGILKWQQEEVSKSDLHPFRAEAFSPDGKYLLEVRASSYIGGARQTDGKVSIREAATGKLIHEIDGIDVKAALFLDGGRKILCDGQPSRLVDVGSGKTLAVIWANAILYGAPTISANGKMALMRQVSGGPHGKCRVDLWDLSIPKRIVTLAESRADAPLLTAMRADGEFAYVAFYGRACAEIWNLAERRRVHVLPLKGLAYPLFSPDNRYLLVRTEAYDPSPVARPAGLALYDQTFHRVWSLSPNPNGNSNGQDLDQALFSADSRYVVTVGNGEVRWLSVKTGRTAHRLPGDGIVLSPDGKHLVVSTDHGLELRPAPKIP